MVISLFWGSIRERENKSEIEAHSPVPQRVEAKKSQQLLRVQSYALRDEAGKSHTLCAFFQGVDAWYYFQTQKVVLIPWWTHSSHNIWCFTILRILSARERERGGKSPFNISPRLKKKKTSFVRKEKKLQMRFDLDEQQEKECQNSDIQAQKFF